MREKFAKYYYTLKYIKPRQLFYRLIFRIKEKTAYYWLSVIRYDHAFYPLQVSTGGLVNGDNKYLGGNTFSFLNITRDFGSRINWRYEGKQKLWYLNLQYFDYLHDEKINPSEKIRLIDEYCNELIHGKIWLEAYPISLRLVNWIIFASKENYFDKKFIRCLQLQTKFLRANLEYHILANHYLENILTLVICANAFHDQALLNFSMRKLKDELKEQILADGGHYEGSPMYHCIILCRLLLLIDVFRNNHWHQYDYFFVEQYTGRMLGWLNSFSFADKTFGHFNDSTDGIAPDVRAIFANAQRLGVQTSDILLGDSGYRKFSNRYMELLLDVGNIMPSYQPGHAHSDMLSFCLNVDGVPIFIDPGISTYEVSVQRTTERSTNFHNTVTVNGTSQSHVWGSFRVAKRARIEITKDEASHLVAHQDGYVERFGLFHQREFKLMQSGLVINDELVGNTSGHTINHAHFYVAAGVLVEKASDENVLLLNKHIRMQFFDVNHIEIVSVDIPDGYNKLVKSMKIIVTFSRQLSTEINRII